MRRLVLALALAIFPTIATSDPLCGERGCFVEVVDPYADSVKRYKSDQNQQDINFLFNLITNLSYAAECKVVTPPTAIWGIIRETQFRLVQSIGTYVELEKKIDEAHRRGKQIAKDEGCGFWSSNPDKVVSVRNLIYNFRATPLH